MAHLNFVSMTEVLAWNRTADLADKSCVLIAILAPPVLIFCSRRFGVLLGAITVWLVLILAGELLRLLDPASRNGFTAVFDRLWISSGWVMGLLYCLPFYGIKLLYLRARQNRPQTEPKDYAA